MSDSELEPRLPIDPQDEELTHYQSVSGLACMALLLGLFSWTAIFTPALWPVAFVGVVVGIAALVRIHRRAPELLGCKPALIGLLLSLVFSFAGPSEVLASRWLVRSEGRRIAAEFLREIQQNRPAAAFQLTIPAGRRAPPTIDLDAAYYAGSDARAGLETFVAQPPIPSLLALGEKARIRYYDTEFQGHDEDGDVLRLLYAVTYEEAGRKTSFFVGLSMRRKVLAAAHVADWWIEGVKGG